MPTTMMSKRDDVESTSFEVPANLDYAHRKRNFRLENLGLLELRAKMEFFGLDVTGLQFRVGFPVFFFRIQRDY